LLPEHLDMLHRRERHKADGRARDNGGCSSPGPENNLEQIVL
jgi:hypothetical protein